MLEEINQIEEIEKGEEVFHSDSRLLLELGERLVATTDVAITELVKNAFDADSSYCRVWHDVEDGKATLHILDEGHGITLEEFRKNWMTIATGIKTQKRTSKKFKRIMTGAKGVGRFAVRFLGGDLILETIAEDPKRECKTRLTAYFDWSSFTSGTDLLKVKIPYKLERVENETKLGTHLKVHNLREDWNEQVIKDVRKQVLAITSPIQGLEAGSFAKGAEGEDPGFEVYFSPPGVIEKQEVGEAEHIINYSWARLTIEMQGKTIKYVIKFRDLEKPSFTYTHVLEKAYINGLYADIRFLPFRKGVFSGIPGVDGKGAHRWVIDRSGVSIIDHGFRMRPYGYEDDDWLNLAADKATLRRKWRSSITEKVFPSNQMIREEKLDPALFLPANHQLVGAVFLESFQSEGSDLEKSDGHENILIPAMDRQGYVDNKAFRQVYKIVRAGLEFLAVVDKKDQLRREELRLENERKEFKREIKEALKHIEGDIQIPGEVKTRIIRSYKRLENQFENIEKYHREARESLEIMSNLGVVAGFMTHESQRIFRDIERLLNKLSDYSLNLNDKELKNLIEETEKTLSEFKGYLEYTDTFIKGIHEGKTQQFKVFPQVERIINKFGNFAINRGIEVRNEINPGLISAPTMVTVYSGILLNLYTNALKAVLSKSEVGEPRRIVFRAWNEPGWHVVQVLDNGIGIPPSLVERIWDPLFSTTASGKNPLGSGMGLGLSIIKRLITNLKGKIDLVDPPAGFKTCFEVRFRNVEN